MVDLDVSVLGGIRMPARALRLLVVDRGRTCPAKDVLALRYCLKVVGIDAEPVPAEMVDAETLGDWADEKFVGEAVGVEVPTGCSHASVAFRCPSSGPAPAFFGSPAGDFQPEADFGSPDPDSFEFGLQLLTGFETGEPVRHVLIVHWRWQVV